MKSLKILLIIILSLMVLTGCSSFPSPKDQTDKSSNSPPAQQEKPTENNSETDKNVQDFKVDTGRYSGRADSNFIEIKISGVPEEMSYRMFMLSDELKEEFDSLDLRTDEVIKFKYLINENEQGVIFEITKI